MICSRCDSLMNYNSHFKSFLCSNCSMRVKYDKAAEDRKKEFNRKIKEYLKENLEIKISFGIGYYDTEKDISVEVLLDGEVISESST